MGRELGGREKKGGEGISGMEEGRNVERLLSRKLFAGRISKDFAGAKYIFANTGGSRNIAFLAPHELSLYFMNRCSEERGALSDSSW